MISPSPSILAGGTNHRAANANLETSRQPEAQPSVSALRARARSLHEQGKSSEVIARALGVTPNIARRLIENRPTELRRVSSMSLIIPGEVVEVLGGYGDETGHVWVQGPRGRYSIPREFLLERFEPLLETISSTTVRTVVKSDAENEKAMQRGKAHAKDIPGRRFEPSSVPPVAASTSRVAESPASPPVSSPPAPVAAAEAPKPRPALPSEKRRPGGGSNLRQLRPLTPADLTPEQRARWRQSLPTIKEQESGSSDDDNTDPNQRIVGGQLTTTEDGRDIIVAKDGTFRHAGTDAYRGLRAIAAEQTLKKRIPTGVKLRQNGSMIEVTLVQPSRRDSGDIRRCVVLRLIETVLDSDFQEVAHKLRATRAEKQLAERVIALRHVEMDREGREIRARVGITISEIRSV